MRYYIIKRLLLSIPTLFGITILTFLITRFVPGGPLEQLLSELKFSETEQQISHEGLVEEGLVEEAKQISDSKLPIKNKIPPIKTIPKAIG